MSPLGEKKKEGVCGGGEGWKLGQTVVSSV